MNKLRFLFLLVLGSVIIGCTDTTETNDLNMLGSEKIITVGVTTSIVQDWVENIGKDYIAVKSMVPSGANPHDFQPGAKDIADFIDSDIVFAIGLNYEEAWLDNILNENPELTRIYLGDYITTIPTYSSDHDEDKNHEGHDDHDEDMDHEGHDDHDEDKDHEGHDDHSLSTEDPHFWFDPLRVISLIEIITLELSKVDPDNTQYYQSESTKYIAELMDLDSYALSEFKKVTDAEEGILSDHSALAYLSDRYGIKLYNPIISNPHAHGEASPTEIANAIENIKENNIPIIFKVEENNAKYAETIANETNAIVANGFLRIESLKPGQSYIDFMKYNVDVIVTNLVK